MDRKCKDKESAQGTMAQKFTPTEEAVETVQQGQSGREFSLNYMVLYCRRMLFAFRLLSSIKDGIFHVFFLFRLKLNKSSSCICATSNKGKVTSLLPNVSRLH